MYKAVSHRKLAQYVVLTAALFLFKPKQCLKANVS